MADRPVPASGRVGDVDWTLRPEWLASRYWWRVFVGGHPKVLVCHREHAQVVAETLAADELQHRRESTSGAAGEPRRESEAPADTAADDQQYRSRRSRRRDP